MRPALIAQFAGFVQALQTRESPADLRYISIIERENDRVQRLRSAIEITLADADFASRVGSDSRWAYQLTLPRRTANIGLIPSREGVTDFEKDGIESEAKAHAFVAMSFKKDLDDLFHYGRSPPVRDAGLLCERIDRKPFTGDILDRIKKRIETAKTAIAVVGDLNPSVYLEVGYAWGKGVPTILLAKNPEKLPFNIRSQRRLKYKTIHDLEKALTKELKGLKPRLSW